MAYNKAQVQAVGDEIIKTINAVKDGIDASDMTQAITLMTAFMSAADEFKDDTDAAMLHLAGHLMDRYGDKRQNLVDPADV